jgi:hypothetical protein
MRCGLLPKKGKISGTGALPGHTLMAALSRLWEHVNDAGALFEPGERQPRPGGTRRRRPRRRVTVIDGPFIEAKELIGG